jgi:uncharacterized protein YcgI (DUF1989 family)
VSTLETIAARTGRAFRVDAGEAVRVVNLHGTQVVDTWALSAGDDGEHLSMSHTRTALGRLRPAVGDRLVSNRRRPLLELEEDTSPGVHDTVIAACDPERYRLLGAPPGHASCAENFRAAVGDGRPVPDPLNLFMNVAWDASGRLDFRAPVSRAGDAVTLRALAPVIVVLSACPMDLNEVNAGEPREIGVEILRS